MSDPWDGKERREHPLDSEQMRILEEKMHVIAKEAAKAAIDEGYQVFKERMSNEMSMSVGRWVIGRVFYAVGAVMLGLGYWLVQKGFIKLP